MSKKNKKSDINTDDFSCLGEFCEDASPLEKSDRYIDSLDIKDTDELEMQEECNLLQSKYIRRHIMSALYFFFWFALLGMVITLIHELITIIAFVSFGYEFEMVIISVDGGTFVSDIPTDAPYWWYLVAFLLPYVVVEGFILSVLIYSLRITVNASYMDGFHTRVLRSRTIKSAIGWYCAIRIYIMILAGPLYDLIMFFFHSDHTTNLTIVWRSVQYIESDIHIAIMRVVIVICSAFLLVLAGLFYGAIRKHELAI